MGQKYASIHIYGGNQEKNLLLLKDFYNNDKSMNVIRKQAISIFKNPEVQRMLERQTELALPDILMVQSEAAVSVYDENISFETIEDKAKAVSNIIDVPVVYTSNFDDDIFIFGIYRSGNLITCKKVGEELSEYDITPDNLEVDKFCSALTIKKMESIETIINSEEIDEIEEEIEKILRVPLKLRFDDIQYDYEQFTEIFIEDRVHAFKVG